MKRPRLFEGVVPSDGLIFQPDEVGERVVANWVDGAELLDLDDGTTLLTWPTARGLRAETAPGLPVQRVGGGFADHPTAESIPAATVARTRGGRVEPVLVRGRIDPGSLLDLGGWDIVTTPQDAAPTDRSEGEPRAPAPTIAVGPPTIDARTAVGLPAANESARQTWRRAFGATGRGTKPRRRTGATDEPHSPPTLHREGPRPVRQFFGRLGGSRRQGRYLRDLERRFAAGDIDEALQRAIPFADRDGPRAWGIPGRRNRLTPSTGDFGPGAIMHIPPSVQAQLRQRYEAAFEQLDRAGRRREAAFVLVDLLDQPDRGCAYLEEHGELGLAADIAETRAFDAGLAVRLLWKVGARERAVAMARRRSAHAAAIARCEQHGDRDIAMELRREWSARQLASGDLIGAHDTLLPCDDPVSVTARERVLDLGLAADGAMRTLMTARAVRTERPDAGDHVARVINGADSQWPEGTAQEIERLADSLAEEPDAEFEADAVRPLLRRVVEIDGGGSKRARTIAERADPVLRADLPHASKPARPSTERLAYALDAADRGIIPVRDARVLSDGSIVSVLDGIGIRLYRVSGRRRMDIDLLCDFVIPADHGGSFLACRRLDSGSVSAWIVHVADGGRQHLGEIRTSVHAATFNGSTWFVAHGSTLWMLDILSDGPTALWQQADLGGPIVGVARSPTRLAVAAARDDAGHGRVLADTFAFGLPQLQPYHRRRIAIRSGSDLLDDGTGVPDAVSFDERTVARVQTVHDRSVVSCHDRWSPRNESGVHVEFPSPDVRAFLDSGVLVVSDGAGRIERVDLAARERLAPIRTAV